jgi:hypothetical protein
MRYPMIAIICTVTASFLPAQPASAGLVRNVVNRTAYAVHKAAHKIDEHIVNPTRREFVRHTRRAHATVHR